MAIEHVAAQVVEVLTRAESLFAAAPDSDAAAAGMHSTGDAAETARVLAARTDDMSGALASGHRDVAAASAGRLEHSSGIDQRLVDHVTRSSQLHSVGLTQASGVRAGAAEVPAQLQPWSDLPASDLAGLKMLRNHLAAMQRLMAHHSAVSARTAGDIAAMSYRPGGSSSTTA
jgi:hypothetical protein